MISRGRSREPRSRSPNKIKQAPFEEKAAAQPKANKNIPMKTGEKSKAYIKEENIQPQQQNMEGNSGMVVMREEKSIKNENKANGEKTIKRSKVKIN